MFVPAIVMRVVSYLIIFCVTAPRQEIYQQYNEGDNENGCGHRPNNAQGLEVELRVGPEPLVLESVEGDVDMRQLVQEHRPQAGLVLSLLVLGHVGLIHPESLGVTQSQSLLNIPITGRQGSPS